MQTTTDSNLDTKLSAIDKALAAAKARKALKEASAPESEEAPSAKPSRAKAETQPDFAKAQKKEALAAARAAAKATREAERQARREAKSADVKGPVHMKKVEKAASKLPALNDTAQVLFTDITTNLSAAQVAAIALHLQHFNRLKATERAIDQRVAPGDHVTIVGGDPRYVGMTGTVDRAQRIRCYVNVPGVRRPVYLFTSDVQVRREEAIAEAS
jgi:flagellar biosynthesis GTPase FlhF